MKSFASIFIANLILQAASPGAALADDWRVVRLSGAALVFYHSRWTPLRLGDIVADDAFVRTMADGALQFTRDRETIDVEPNTQIQIVDRKGERFTTVREYFGAVGVEANRERVQHFSVQTPFLAAVVKGTIFAVASHGQGSTVAVARGKVGVRSLRGAARGDVGAGQTAAVGANGALSFGAGAAAGSAASAAASVASAVAAATASAAASSSSAAAASSAAASSAAAGASAASGPGAASGAPSHGAAAGSANGAGQGNSGQGHSSQGNSGQGNSGHGNSGQGNAGQGNSGQGNSGQGNSGHGNSCQGNSGHGGASGPGGHGGGPGSH